MRTALAAALLFAPISGSAQDTRTDAWLTSPVDDATFRTYLQFFAYNDRLSFDAVTGERVERDGVVREHLTFISTPGLRVTAYVYRSADAGRAAGRGGVIFLHGGVAAGKGSRTMSYISGLLARDGWTVLTIDLLHYGERTTDVLTTFTTQEKAKRLYNEPSTYLEFVTQTVKDVSRAYDYLTRVQGVDSTRVVLVGFSRGAVLSSIAGAADPRLSAVALLHGGHMGLLVEEHRSAACPANYLGRISPRPVLMLNTKNDGYFLPETQIRPWMAAAKEPLTVHWVDGPHGFFSEGDLAVVLEWLREVTTTGH